MTTIAYKDGVLVSDSRETVAKRIDRDNAQKLFRLANGAVLGCAGSSLAARVLVDKLNNSVKDHKRKKAVLPTFRIKNCLAILLAHGNKVYYFENGMWEDISDIPHYSIGSGSDYALAAMDAGASALEAVKIAAKRDIYSGGRIVSMSPKEV